MKRFLAVVMACLLFFTAAGCNAEFVSSDFKQKTNEIIKILDSAINGEEIKKLEFSSDYVFPPVNAICYNMLNEKQKEIYKQLFAAAEQMPYGYFTVCEHYENVIADIALAYNALLNDCAEIFWMPNSYLLGEATQLGKRIAVVAFEISDEENEKAYTVAKSEREEMRKELKKKIDELVTSVKNLSSDYEKELYFYDYLCNNTEYQLEGELVHTAYSTLCEGKALCEGYSRAFKLLCNGAGIECDLISGTAGDEAHMWNVVKIDGEYCYADVTWDDRDDSLDYLYFNITYNQLINDHTLSPVFSALNAEKLKDSASYNFKSYGCNTKTNSYFLKNNLIVGKNFAAEGARIINEAAAKGLDYAVFLVENEEFLRKLKLEDTSDIAKIQDFLGKITINGYVVQRDVVSLHFE